MVYAIKKIERDGRLLLPDELKRDYAPTLASFMESSLVEFDGQRRFPQYAEEHARALVAGDVSSWDEELCLFSGESALIYYPLVGRGLAYVGGPLGLDAHAYSAYWAGIVRGIEHLVAFRAEAQQTERRTTGLLGQIPGLTRKVNDGTLERRGSGADRASGHRAIGYLRQPARAAQHGGDHQRLPSRLCAAQVRCADCASWRCRRRLSW